VAYKARFNNISYFNRCFRKLLTPAAPPVERMTFCIALRFYPIRSSLESKTNPGACSHNSIKADGEVQLWRVIPF
jgi:hypothetical protein